MWLPEKDVHSRKKGKKRLCKRSSPSHSCALHWFVGFSGRHTGDLTTVLEVDAGEGCHVRNGFQTLVSEGGATLEVQAGHSAQGRERSQAVVYERHMPPPVQAQSPA